MINLVLPQKTSLVRLSHLGWAVSYGDNQESDTSVCFTKFNAVPNPKYRPRSAALRTPTRSFDVIDT